MTNAPTFAVRLRDIGAQLADVSDSPALEARRLLAWASGLSETRLIIDANQPVDAETRTRLEPALARRLAGEPLAYVLGRIGFHAIELAVNHDVLIPRADTETLVDATLACLGDRAGLAVADLGTGSGAIALALAHARPGWQITATDAHEGALACARANAAALGITNVAFAHGDWLTPLRKRRFAAIVSNPPYIEADDPHLAATALGYEPRHALVAADAGLADLRRIVEGAGAHLLPGGWLIVEHGYRQGLAVRRLFEQAGYQSIETRHDLGDNPRITLGYL